MFFFHLILTCLFIFLPATTLLAKNLKADELIQQANVKAAHLSNPAVATFWGGFRRFKIFNQISGNLFALESSLLKTRKIDVYISQKSTKAPLFVFMPGIFGRPLKGLTPQMIELLEKSGGHVLVVPNLFSPEYMEAHPLYQHDPIALETKIMEQALDFCLQHLKFPVSRIHVIAESLGTSIGSAWVAHDQQNLKRLNSLTLLWPPLNLPLAMTNFDKIINDHRQASKECSFVTKLWLVAKEFVLKDYPGPLEKKEQDCLGAMVLVDGFIGSAKRSWEVHAKVIKSDKPGPEGFEAFFRQYRPEFWKMIERKDEKTTLSYWFSKIRQDQQFPLFIMTAENDFINLGLSWMEFKKTHQLSDREILLLPWGGHSGPIGMPGFSTILKAYSPAFKY